MAGDVGGCLPSERAPMLKRHPSVRIDPFGAPSVKESLQFLVVSRIHAGSLKPGDRLPSIRDVAHRSGADHRVVAEAYRTLESDGLVEVRPKAGVFVSPTFNSLADRAAESWIADILFDAWEKGISRSALCRMFGGMLSSPVRCGCIESNEDHMVALAGAIEDGLCLEAVPIRVAADADETSPLPADVADVDVIVTSVFHAKYARAVAARENKPVAILNLRRDFALAIATRCAERPITAVMVDREFANRSRELSSAIGDSGPVRFLSLEEALQEDLDLNGNDLLITRAARRRLGLADYHLVPSPPLVSEDSARGLCEIVAAATPNRPPRLKLEPSGRAFREPVRPAAANRFGRPERDGAGVARSEALSPEAIVRVTEVALEEEGLHAALRVLNGTTGYRFTGVYRFEPGWVRSVALYDRENPHLLLGADVPMKESYCTLTADAGVLQVENAQADPRLEGHRARAAVLCYCAVHLVDSAGASWGTLCHYDFKPAEVQPETVTVLEAVRLTLQRVLGPAVPCVRTLPDCGAKRPRYPRIAARGRGRGEALAELGAAT